MMFLAVYLPFILGLTCGYLLNETIRIAKDCREIKRSLKRK